MTPETIERFNTAAEKTITLLNHITTEAERAADALLKLSDAQAKITTNPDEMEVIKAIFGQAFRDARKRK
jgi:hypothetical protein